MTDENNKEQWSMFAQVVNQKYHESRFSPRGDPENFRKFKSRKVILKLDAASGRDLDKKNNGSKMWTKRTTIRFVVEVGESGNTHAPLRTGPPDSIVDNKITKRFLPNRIGLRPPPKKKKYTYRRYSTTIVARDEEKNGKLRTHGSGPRRDLYHTGETFTCTIKK
jgi:hypothetical protein